MSQQDDKNFGDRPFFSQQEIFDMNLAFAQAMLAARKKGLERFTLGIQKDDTAFVPTHFARISYSSGMGSSAQSCIDEMPSQLFGNGGGRHRQMDGGKARG